MRRVTRCRYGFSIGRFSSESTLKKSSQRGRAIRGTHVRGRTIQIMMGQIETPDIRWSALTAPPADPAEKAFDPDTFFRAAAELVARFEDGWHRANASYMRGTHPKEALHMGGKLEGARVAAVVEEGFERIELVEPKRALEEAGAVVDVISPHKDVVRSWTRGDWAEEFRVGVPLSLADPDRYDALLLPGGVRNPDRLRRNEDAWRFVRAFFAAGKTVAAICHAPWVLIDAGVIDGRRLTSYPSLQTDLKNAGAAWVDEEVVVHRGLVTSRSPRDLPAFNKAMIDEISRSRARPE
jgi:protease I